MPEYMLQFSYAANEWAALIKSPSAIHHMDRTEAISILSKRLGGRLVSFHYTMGDHDGVAIVEAPDDSTALAIVVAASLPGHVTDTKTTRLYTPNELVAALRKAEDAGYKPGADPG